MKKIFILTVVILFMSCKGNNEDEAFSGYKEIEFKLEGFEWDEKPYKFSSYIKNQFMKSNGPQKTAWAFSYIGDIENMHKMWDDQAEVSRDLTSSEKDDFAQYKATTAIEYILESAKEHQFVIINEGHHMPQHRVFTTQLLEGLKKQGYTHLGLETYFAQPKNNSHLRKNGYPTLKSGYYTKEPQFGNLVREAHEKGFDVFGYESQGHSNGKEREINQARNIQEYMQKHPNEKILIHCGFDHAKEGDLNRDWEKAMAGRLKEFTGIDPLTIDQVKYSEKGERKYENPYYQLTDLEEPSVFINDDGDLFAEFDIDVFHPRSRGFDRPKWMTYDDRKEVELSFEDADIDCPCLVFAYKNGEEIGSAIPYDIQETVDKNVNLVLDESDYNIVLWNEKGRGLKYQLINSNN